MLSKLTRRPNDGTTVTVNSEHYGHVIIDFFCLLLTNMTWRVCGFNKTMPHATQAERIWLYCKRTRNFSLWRHQLATRIMRFDTVRLLLWGYEKDRVYADKPSTIDRLKTNFRQWMSKSVRKLPQKDQWWQHFTWKSFKWCGVSHIMSTF